MTPEEKNEYLATYAAVMLPEQFNGTSAMVYVNIRYLGAPVEFKAEKRAKEEDFFQKAMARLIQHRYIHVIRDDFRILGLKFEDLTPFLKS